MVMLLSAFESLAFLFLTIRLLIKVGPFRLYLLATSNPVITFALVFSLIFAFGVGFTSYNFGALVRYKIPCMPFYLIALQLFMYHAVGKKVESGSSEMHQQDTADEMEDYYRTDTKRLSQSW